MEMQELQSLNQTIKLLMSRLWRDSRQFLLSTICSTIQVKHFHSLQCFHHRRLYPSSHLKHSHNNQHHRVGTNNQRNKQLYHHPLNRHSQGSNRTSTLGIHRQSTLTQLPCPPHHLHLVLFRSYHYPAFSRLFHIPLFRLLPDRLNCPPTYDPIFLTKRSASCLPPLEKQ